MSIAEGYGNKDETIKHLEGIIKDLQKKEVWLKRRLDSLANFNPDWDILKVTQENLHNCLKEIKDLQQKLDGCIAGNSYLRNALYSLIELKKHKDSHGKTEKYLEQMPNCWNYATEVLQLEKEKSQALNKIKADAVRECVNNVPLSPAGNDNLWIPAIQEYADKLERGEI